jgi:hypothetical protein
MAFPFDPVTLGLGALAIGGGWLLLRGKKSGVDKAVEDAKKKAALKVAYDVGCKDGEADGVADGGKPRDPRPAVNYYAADKALQAEAEHGYNDCYEAKWVAPEVVIETTDPVPAKPGGAKKLTPYQYGCQRGRARAISDYTSGSGDSPEPHLKKSGSIERANETGDPEAYKKGYRECYVSAYAQKATEEAWEDVDPFAVSSGVARTGAVGSASRMCGVARTGSWGPRVGLVLAARPALAARARSATSAPGLERCRSWGLRRGRADALAGRDYDREIVGHSDIARDIADPAARERCAKAIVDGYHQGYLRNKRLSPTTPIQFGFA